MPAPASFITSAGIHSAGLAATTAAEPGLVGLVPKPIEPVTSATLSSSDIAATSSLVRKPGLLLVSIHAQLAAAARCGTAPAAASATAAATSARTLRWCISLPDFCYGVVVDSVKVSVVL